MRQAPGEWSQVLREFLTISEEAAAVQCGPSSTGHVPESPHYCLPLWLTAAVSRGP